MSETKVRDTRASAAADVVEPRALAKIEAGGPSAMTIIQEAVRNKMDLGYIERLMDLKDRHDKAEAKKAFDAAMAAARAEYPEGGVKKTKRVAYEVKDKKPGDKDVEYWHETLDGVTSVLDPLFAKYGLSYRWEIDQEVFEGGAQFIKVTSFIDHEAGHSKTVSLKAPPDDSGKKNPIQKITSTISYLERVTLKANAGIAAGDDDDARSAYEEKNEFDVQPWVEKIDAAFDKKDRAACEEVKKEMAKRHQEGEIPKWAFDSLTAHYAENLTAAKKAAKAAPDKAPQE